MLTADLAQSWQRGNRTGPRYIDTKDDGYRADARDLLAIFAAHEGRTRAELQTALDAHVGLGVDYRILRGLIKLLTDRCTFETASAKDPVEIRRALFLKAGAHHPVLADASARAAIVREAALEVECTPEAVLEGLYADLPENQRLVEFDALSGEELLDLYNLAQAQALLYRCTLMQLSVAPQAAEGYRALFGAIKAYRLIHTIRGAAQSGYEITLDGPVSMFHRSQKYGVQMAVFLPALLLCGGWQMRAEISMKIGENDANKNKSRTAYFELESGQQQLRTHYFAEPPADDSVREKLLANWAKFTSLWELEESSVVIDLGDAAFIPDFVLRHRDGREVYLELLGFWTPRYLETRLKEFAHSGRSDYLIAAWDELRGSREPLARAPAHTIIYKRNLDPASLEAALAAIESS